MVNGIVPREQKVKCPKCGKTKIANFGCTKPFEFCKKCGCIMQPCAMNIFEKFVAKILK